MDATDGAALVTSAAISEDRIDGNGPDGPHDSVEGLQYSVSYTQTSCDLLA
jgi:hypothetical protein